MARRRYLLALDAREPMRWVDRYLANSSIYQRTSGLAAARRLGAAAMARTNANNDRIRELIAEQDALTQRLASTDLFARTAWFVEGAGAVEAGVVTPRIRDFILATGGQTYQTVLCADREGAAAALAAARSADLQQIGRMDPASQSAAVFAMARNFAAYFSALGVSVKAWAKYRNAVKGDSGTEGLQNFLVSDYAGTFPRGYDLLFGSRPSGPPASAALVMRTAAALRAPEPSPPWPSELLALARSWQGINLTPTSDSPLARSTIRDTDVYAIYRASIAAQNPSWNELVRARVSALYGDEPSMIYFGPKPIVDAAGRNVMRMSIDNAGTLVTPPQSPEQFARVDCVLRDGVTGRADGTTGGLPQPQAGFNWMCGAVTRDPQNRAYYLAPLLWYAQLFWPLLNYLATRDPLEVAYEVQLDVLGKNLWTVIATGRGESALVALGAQHALGRASTGTPEYLRNLNLTAGAILTAVSAAAPPVAAVGGVALAAVNLFAEATRAPPTAPRGDAFDRQEPVIEQFQITPGGVRDFQCGDVGVSEPVAVVYHGNDARESFASAPLSLGEMAGYGRAAVQTDEVTTFDTALVPVYRPALRTERMIPYWTIYIDGVAAPNGRWDGTAWLVDATPGDHRLRIVPPPGQSAPARSMIVRVPASGEAIVAFEDVPAEAAAPLPPAPPPPPRPPPTATSSRVPLVLALVAATVAVGGGAAYVWRDEIRRAIRPAKPNGARRRRRRERPKAPVRGR